MNKAFVKESDGDDDDLDHAQIFYGLAGSALVEAARDAGLTVAQEVFADRTYQDDGTLTPRSDPRALITDIEISIRQVFEMLREGVVTSVNGVAVPIQADTLCIHGDQPGAALFAQRIRAALDAAGIAVCPPRAPAGHRRRLTPPSLFHADPTDLNTEESRC
ncbi:MAG: LamB/YcsF family protein [Burkholderia gladioli]